jgi:hypothetical protein
MSTEIAQIRDRFHPEDMYVEVYIGTGGIALYNYNEHISQGTKIWLTIEGAEELIEALQSAIAAISN